MLLAVDGYVGDIKSYGLINTFDNAFIVNNGKLYWTGQFSFNSDSILCVNATGAEPSPIFCYVDSNNYLRVKQ